MCQIVRDLVIHIIDMDDLLVFYLIELCLFILGPSTFFLLYIEKGWKYQIELKIITVFLYVCSGLCHRVVFFSLTKCFYTSFR